MTGALLAANCEVHMLELDAAQTERFSGHLAECETCRLVVIAGWSTSVDVIETLDDLCVAGASIISVPVGKVASA